MRMRLALRELVDSIGPIVLHGLASLRDQLSPLPVGSICRVGEQSGASAHTWYLSILRCKESEEVAVTVNVQEPQAGYVELTADVCFGPRVLFDEKNLPDHAAPALSALSMATEIIQQFFAGVPKPLDEAVELMNADTTSGKCE